MNSCDSPPILAITMGDAAGIGPEIIAMALKDRQIYDICRPVVIGDRKIMERALRIAGSAMDCRKISKPQEGGLNPGVIDLLDLDNLPADMPFAVVDARTGKAAYEYVGEGVRLAMKGEICGIVSVVRVIVKIADKIADYSIR
jgi:4-hydroxy-L-threonine phosphate dehydrogenase PdxA